MDQRIRSAIFERVRDEAYARKLEMRLVELDPGHAVVEMNPQEDITNIHGMTHGGAIFSVIDEAFQASCNSYGTIAVALNVTVTYHNPPDGKGRLVAESTEIHRSRKTATYDIRVTDDRGVLIATCRALAYRKKERLPFLD